MRVYGEQIANIRSMQILLRINVLNWNVIYNIKYMKRRVCIYLSFANVYVRQADHKYKHEQWQFIDQPYTYLLFIYNLTKPMAKFLIACRPPCCF